MKHYLDICDVRGDQIEPVDIITFGSPCQDLSVAGKREGLKHEGKGDDETTRSGLFMEAVRIIREMREATNGEYPKYALWENVTGAFSSNKGEDFRVVLEELARLCDKTVSIPLPPKGRWLTSGFVDYDDWSLAWRTVDAQYHGVPQRRRRILLVTDFTGRSAAEISFKCEGLPGYPEPGAKAGQGAPQDAQRGTGTDGGTGTIALEGNGSRPSHQGNGYNETDKMYTLNTIEQHAVCYGLCSYESNSMKSNNPNSGIYEAGTSRTIDLNGGNPSCNQGGMAVVEPAYTMQMREGKPGGGKGPLIQTDKSATLSTANIQTLFEPKIIENHPNDSRVNIIEDGPFQSLTGRMGTGGGNTPMIMEPYCFGNGQVHQMYLQDKCGALNCLDDQQKVIVPKDATDLVAYGLDRAPYNQGQNAQYDFSILPEQQPTLTARGLGACAATNPEQPRYIVRRLTPTECARLQGFPDNWGAIEPKEDMTDEEVTFWNDVYITHQRVVNGKEVKPKTKQQLITWYNKLWTDSAEYKMWGNGVALPCVRVPIKNMADRGAKTLGSLFDGSGGFPLAGALHGIEPVWASEIEPYPIAVTVNRFKERSEDDT